MTEQVVPSAQLLTCADYDFDNHIKNMSIKNLVEVIILLQKEMVKEQENFNRLSSSLLEIEDRKSRQYKTISCDMAASQEYLTTLMNRSIKCFSKQNLQQNMDAVHLQRLLSNKNTEVPQDALSKLVQSNNFLSDASQDKRKRNQQIGNKTNTVSQLPNSVVHSPPLNTQNTTSLVVSNDSNDGVLAAKSNSTVESQSHVSMANNIDSSSNKQSTESRPHKMSVTGAPTSVSTTIPVLQSGSNGTKKASAESEGQKISVSDAPSYSVSNINGIVQNPNMTMNMSSNLEPIEKSSIPNTMLTNHTPISSEFSNSEKVFLGLPNVKLLAQAFTGTSQGASDSTTSKHQPVIRSQNIASSDGNQLSKSSKVKGNLSSDRSGELHRKKGKQFIAPTTNNATNSMNDQSEFQNIYSKFFQSKETSQSSSDSDLCMFVGDVNDHKTKTSIPTTNLDKKKSSSTIVLSIKSNLESFTNAQSTQGEQVQSSIACALQRTQSPDEVYVTVQKPHCKPKAENRQKADNIDTLHQWNSVMKTSKPSDLDAGQSTSYIPAEDHQDAVTEEQKIPRMNLINWNPKTLLNELYNIKYWDETVEDISHSFIFMEGWMEKLPLNKNKSTLLKIWKRRFFRAKDGWLEYYESKNHEKPSEIMQLMGGHIEDMGNRILGIDDGRGHFLMVRAPTEKEHGQWKIALESQTADNTKTTYIKPVLHTIPHTDNHVIVIDLGSSSIRAGVLGENVSLPQVFFPTVIAMENNTGKMVVGNDAFNPEIRNISTLMHPIQPSSKVDQALMKKLHFDEDMMSAIFSKVFTELKVDPKQYMVMLSIPQPLGDSMRSVLMKVLVEKAGVIGVCMVQQSLLALYSYHTRTGIIIDIGQHIEILPIYDGFIIESGVAWHTYGSQNVIDSMKKALLETNYRFASKTENLLVRYIVEQTCYVASNYKEEETIFKTQPGKLKRIVNLSKFNLPEGAYRQVEVEEGRFKSPEGFFNVDLWEMDFPTLHKLVFRAIQSCPIDNRRHMYRSVYLSGGVTLIPGFVDRLFSELRKLAPPAVKVEVHASPHRYHAAYLGACALAGMPQFPNMIVSREEWSSKGVTAFRKWHTPAP